MAVRCITVLALTCAVASTQPDDWSRLWAPNGAALPEPVQDELARRLPHGPIGPLSSLEGPTQPAFDSALSALYFLEETYGTARMIEFRRQCLMSSRATNGKGLPASVFRAVFGKDVTVLDGEWRAFFGWTRATP